VTPEDSVAGLSSPQQAEVDIPYEQLQSFVRHDIYAPTAMLKHFLQSMVEISLDPDSVRETLEYAAGLTSELDWLLGLLVDALAVAGSGAGHAQLEPTLLAGFVTSLASTRGWGEASEEACVRHLGALDQTEVLVDRGLVERALVAIVYQWSRMGNLPGAISLTLEATDGSTLEMHKTRGRVAAADLERAIAGDTADWQGYLRRLPACGLPLRVARGLLVASGAHLECRDDADRGAVLRISFIPASAA
jgi:hypothetical protein